MRRRLRAYTLVELAVASVLTLLMVTAMVRWVLDVAVLSQDILSGRDDLPAQVALFELQTDLNGAASCEGGPAALRISSLGGQTIVMPTVAHASGGSYVFRRVEWRVHPTEDGMAALQRRSTPTQPPGAAECGEDPVTDDASWGVYLEGIDRSSGFFHVGGDPILLCEPAAGLCTVPSAVVLKMDRGGESLVERSLLLPR